MAINLKARIEAAKQDMEREELALIILGPASGGKSTAMGTMGVKTLFCYFSGETHGVAAANKAQNNPDLIPVCVDIDENGNKIAPDKAYEDFVALLEDVNQLRELGIQAVAIDGATELEHLITSTDKWNVAVQSKYKGNESFAGPITVGMFRPILDALRKLQRELKIHYVISCLLNVKEVGDNGILADASPQLAGFNVANGLLQQIPDRLIIAHTDTKDGVEPRFQVGAKVGKSTKDFKTQEISKIASFRPQIQGVNLATAPAILKPDLSKIIQYKRERKQDWKPKTPPAEPAK